MTSCEDIGVIAWGYFDQSLEKTFLAALGLL